MEEPEVRGALEAFLTGGRPAVLATADRFGSPHTSLITWLVARDARTVALALDRRSQHFRNL